MNKKIKMRKCKCGCGNTIIGHLNKKFVNKRHKDKYHNRVNPRGIYAYLHPDNINKRSIEDEMHPFDPYSLGQE